MATMRDTIGESAVVPRRPLVSTVTELAVLTRRSLRHTFRQIDGLFVVVMLPVAMLLLFVYVFGGAMAVGTAYLDYVVPGIILLTAGYSASLTAVEVHQDLASGMTDRFRSLPIGDAAVLWSHVLSGLVRNLLSTAIVIGVAVVIGFRPAASVVMWLAAVAFVVAYILTIAWMSALIGMTAKSLDAASGFTFVMLLFPYLSSAFVPTDTLPGPLQPIARYQPITPAIEAVRSLLGGAWPGAEGWGAAAWCLGVVAVTLPLASRRYRRLGRAGDSASGLRGDNP